MVFSSTIFLFLFLPVTIAGYYLLKNEFRNVFLLIVSLIFYAWGEPKFVLILLLSVFANYIFALLVDKYRASKITSKIILTIMVLANVSIFFVFKYLGFATTNLNLILGTNLTVPNIALPIGISFFTFQAMSYVFDVYRQKGKVQRNPLNVGLYVAFFPQLVAGPIVRYETVAREIHERHENITDFAEGISRFIFGLAKKVVLSNSLAVIADYFYGVDNYSEISVAGAWLGAVCYTLQIFTDFSGYSDMAIGLGKMFGFHFPENFNYPYIATSITDFWRRWHITLSTWFRDYIYIPMGGNRVSSGRHIFNLFVVWLLTGFWHGASWNFVCWGLMYFLLLVFEKYTKIAERLGTVGQVLYRIFTLVCVNFGWVLFRAPGLKKALDYGTSMLGLNNNALIDEKTVFIFGDMCIILVLGILASIPLKEFLKEKLYTLKHGEESYEFLRVCVLMVLLIVSISYCVNGYYNPFIYFNF